MSVHQRSKDRISKDRINKAWKKVKIWKIKTNIRKEKY
jgi:hypothetical protein